MVQKCSAFGCLNASKKNSGITFHKFPSMKRTTFREKWIHAMKRKGFQPGNYARVCSDHFNPEDFQPRIKLKVLKRDAVPRVVIGDRKVENPRRELSKTKSRFSCVQCEYVASGKEHLRSHVKYAHIRVSSLELCPDAMDQTGLSKPLKQLIPRSQIVT